MLQYNFQFGNKWLCLLLRRSAQSKYSTIPIVELEFQGMTILKYSTQRLTRDELFWSLAELFLSAFDILRLNTSILVAKVQKLILSEVQNDVKT